MKKNDNTDYIDDLIDISHIENRAEIEKDNVASVSKELKHIPCPKCGYMNFELTKKCTKCHYDLDKINKSCPKCGKINANATKKCECGFNFTKSQRPLIVNVIIAVLVMAVLFVGMKYYGDILDKYDVAVKVIVGYVIFVFACKMFFSSSPDDGFGAEHEMLEKYKRRSNPRLVRNLLIIFGFVGAVGFLVYYYYFR